MNKGCPAFPKR